MSIFAKIPLFERPHGEEYPKMVHHKGGDLSSPLCTHYVVRDDSGNFYDGGTCEEDKQFIHYENGQAYIILLYNEAITIK